MAIEGPLRDLGIHDVFQLLDLGRKSGTLTVSSELRNNQGQVWFEQGHVVYASIQSNPNPLGGMLVRSGRVAEGDVALARAMQSERGDTRRLGEILVDIGALTLRELNEQVRRQVEAVVFELLSWDEGYFRFEEEALGTIAAEATVRIPTESVLMEAARQIDEWSRIRERVPSLDVIPCLAGREDGAMPRLDLLPGEWLFLTMIDGLRSLREIAGLLGESDFNVARIAFGLLSTGVLSLSREGDAEGSGIHVDPVADAHVRRAHQALRGGDWQGAAAEARLALAAEPHASEARRTLVCALRRSGRRDDWAEEVRRAARLAAQHPDVWLEAGYLAVMEGDFEGAERSWQLYLAASTEGTDAERARTALETTALLRDLLEGHFHD